MAERKFIVLGDSTTHGGKVVSAWGQDGPSPMTIDGIPVACIGDKVTCPRCRGTHTIVSGASGPVVELEGRQIAREGDWVSDGSKLVSAGQSIATHGCDGDADDVARLAADRAKVREAQAKSQAEAAKGIQTASAGGGITSEEARMLAEQTGKKLELDYSISFKSGGNRVLTPLEIPDFKELPSGSTKNKEIIDFEIVNKKDPADSVLLEVLDGGNVIYSESDTSGFLPNGKYSWKWDGYDSNDVLDTKVLKSNNLIVRLTAKQSGKEQVKELKLKNYANEVRWVDAKVNRGSKEIEITVRPSFSDGGISGPPIPGYTPKTFEELKKLAKGGIEKYWTRDGSRPSGIGVPTNTAKGTFKVRVKADVNVEPMADGFALMELLRKRRQLGSIRPDDSTSVGSLSKIVHMAHYWIVDAEYTASEADEDFEHTAAHEFGHRIMSAYGGRTYSWTHDSSSSKYTQQPLPGSSYPASGEINLMHYAERYNSFDRINRSVASEQDVKSLLWLARVKFN